jgi:hypothetical protein
VSLIPVVNFLFSAGAVDSGVIDTGGAPLLANISENLFLQNDPNVIFRGLGQDDS